MKRAVRDTLIALLVGGGLGGGLYWLGGRISLVVVTGLCWACGLRLTFYVGQLYPTYATGNTWVDKRWTGLGIGLVNLAALVGVSPMLPIPNELRLGLGFLVGGAGLVAYSAGTLAVLERVESDPNGTASSPETHRSADSN